MHSLLKFTVIETNEFEKVIELRQAIIDEALANNDYDTLQSIALIDKENLAFLQQEKDALEKQLRGNHKLKHYCE